jgi:hypothetical protein
VMVTIDESAVPACSLPFAVDSGANTTRSS